MQDWSSKADQSRSLQTAPHSSLASPTILWVSQWARRGHSSSRLAKPTECTRLTAKISRSNREQTKLSRQADPRAALPSRSLITTVRLSNQTCCKAMHHKDWSPLCNQRRILTHSILHRQQAHLKFRHRLRVPLSSPTTRWPGRATQLSISGRGIMPLRGGQFHLLAMPEVERPTTRMQQQISSLFAQSVLAGRIVRRTDS